MSKKKRKDRHLTEEREEFPSRAETPFVNFRLSFLFLVFCLVAGVFGVKIYQLTILKGPYYREASENNFLTRATLIAPRGRILDRAGRPLAINRPLFDVAMSPYRMRRERIEQSLRLAAELLGRPDLTGRLESILEQWPPWESITLAAGLTLDEVLPVLEHAYELPGVEVAPRYQRFYPVRDVTGLITGHVGSITRQTLDQFLERGYERTEKVGKLGAEFTFEEQLHGRNGQEAVIRDARGRPLRRWVDQPAQPGQTLILTLDLELQELAYKLLEGWKGAIIMMDPRDGAVLAAAARPAYDPNFPTRGSSYNRITQGNYPPGSVFKVVTAAGGLADGRPPSERFYCDGLYHVPGVRARFPCHFRWGHEWEDLYDALQHSCNVYFFAWAHRLGYPKMIEMSSAFGFGRRSNFELVTPVQESPGKLGGAEAFLGNVLQMGIGQGQLIEVTPIQMARAYAAIANGGTLHRPYIVKEVRTSTGELVRTGEAEVDSTLPLTLAQLDEIREGLRRVVHERGGTASRTGFKPEWKVAGKTGSAQTGRPGPTHAWFGSYAPYDDPEVAMLILVEQSGHGGEIAAPLARQLYAAYFGEPEPEIVPPPLHEADEEQAETED